MEITAAASVDDKTEVLHEARGKHLLLTLRQCVGSGLNDIDWLSDLTRRAVGVTGAKILEIRCHQFSPQGITVLAVLAESHASLHTYPESNVVFWDCFTCGSSCQPERSIEILLSALKPVTVSRRIIER